MWQTNLKIIGIVLGTLGLYTVVASSIPQVASEVPEELTFTGEVSAEQLMAAGEELYSGAGSCTTCHGTGTRAPNLLTDHNGEGTIVARCGDRVAGESCKDYLYQSLVEPTAHVVEGFPAMVFQARTFSDAQLWSLVAYLESQGGTVTVTGDDIDTSGDAGGGATGVTMTPGTGPSGAAGATTDPRQLLQDNLCLGCHVIDGAGPPLGPSFDGIGTARTSEQIRHGILDPNADAPPGFEAVKGVMPTTFGQQLTAAQLEAIVTYLSNRK
jgi:mono/diheme cytochrome c family protein